MTLAVSGGTVSFKYDPLGRRIEKSSSATTSVFAYDGNNLVEETNSSGAVVARYAQTEKVDEPLAMLRSGATSYYNADGLGSVTSLTNAAGAAAETYTYDSFGKVTASAGSLTNPFQYTGRELDPETGLYYYRARYYDPAAGRFLSEDTSGFGGGDVNLYRYVGNSPVSYIDPGGLDRLPGDPSGLGPQWTRDPSHSPPNGSRWRNPNGDQLDFDKGRPGQPGWRGRDHWHLNDCDKHLKPGDEVPVQTGPPDPADPPVTPPITKMLGWVGDHTGVIVVTGVVIVGGVAIILSGGAATPIVVTALAF
jgi:RHS repeat-associated protein